MADSNDNYSPSQEKLIALVEQIVAEQGQEFEGKVWAVWPRSELAKETGLSQRTVSRIINKPPFDTLQKLVEGRRGVLVRVGIPDPNQPSRLAAYMARHFRGHIVRNDKLNAKQIALCEEKGEVWKPKKSVTPKEYGCLIGLAEDLRPGWQQEIFRYATSQEGWKQFKNLTKYKTQDLEAYLCDENGKPKIGFFKLFKGKAHLFQHYPHIPTLRLFWRYAETVFVDHAQEQCGLTGAFEGKDKNYWLQWGAEVDPQALVDWEPNWKTEIDPIDDVKD